MKSSTGNRKPPREQDLAGQTVFNNIAARAGLRSKAFVWQCRWTTPTRTTGDRCCNIESPTMTIKMPDVASSVFRSVAICW
jgi:hypothetical protein